ncbi:MAG: DNA-3-methyladenine glycosylase 2 family protein [Archangium sp.]|nr:DNA-3-methyladenine glycosylase 2 family protein [Archangium sp.]
MTTNRFSTELQAPFGFSLSAAAEFYAGFAPMGGAAQLQDKGLQLGVRLDGTFEPVSATLSQKGSRILVEAEGTTDQPRLIKQLSRMLGLDADGRAWAAVGERDDVLGRLKKFFPGFFTAGFPSPYEAGLGGVLSQRSSVKQAAALRRKLSAAHGSQVGGMWLVPAPKRLLAVKAFPGISERKMDVLHGIARAALDGKLEADRLLAMPTEAALESLESLDGVGPWTAAHMLMRGASVRDVLPTSEPRVLRAFAAAYQRPESDYAKVSEGWRPFRMWAAIILVRNLAREGGWAAVPEDFARRGRRSAMSSAVAR